MPKPKTHFEQVPLETVKKIIEEEVDLKKTNEPVREAKKKKWEEDFLEAGTIKR
jgi:hypothetical protein